MSTYADTLEASKEMLIERIKNHSFLRRCRLGKVSLEELKFYLIQQGFYSAHFTRYLCAAMSNMQCHSDILALVENLTEELGVFQANPKPHYLIYREMLDTFSLTLDAAAQTEGTKLLVDTMFFHCRNENPAQGLGALCLGAEALVPSIYSDIITGFNSCGIVGKDIEFFSIHVECDDGHAETLSRIMVNVAGNNEKQMQLMLDAGNDVVSARMKFFSDIESQYCQYLDLYQKYAY